MKREDFQIVANDYGKFDVLQNGKRIARNLPSFERARFTIQRCVQNCTTDKKPLLGRFYDAE